MIRKLEKKGKKLKIPNMEKFENLKNVVTHVQWIIKIKQKWQWQWSKFKNSKKSKNQKKEKENQKYWN